VNILDKIKVIIATDTPVFLGFMPAKPDDVICLFEYQGAPPEHYFNKTDIVQSVQVKIRGKTSNQAYSVAETVANTLNRYQDNNISVLQSASILDIGYDNANPQRQEYTINFKIRRI